MCPCHLQVQQMALRCVQRNIRALRGVAKWSWWRLFCRVRPLLDVNMDDERLRAKEVHTRSRTNTHTHVCTQGHAHEFGPSFYERRYRIMD